MTTGVLAFSTLGISFLALIGSKKTPTSRQWVMAIAYLFFMALANGFNPKLAKQFALLVFVGACLGSGYTLIKKIGAN